jgi:hypothetical protein
MPASGCGVQGNCHPGASDYRWKNEYSGPKYDLAKKRKNLERENARLKKIVADLSLS